MSGMSYSSIFCVALLMDRFVMCVSYLTVFGCDCYFVVECNGSVESGSVESGSAQVDRRVCSSKECVCYACEPSVHLDVPSICFCLCLYMLYSSFRSLRAGSQVFALLMLFLCVILHTMWSGNSMQLICILLFGILCLPAIRMMFVKIQLPVCMLVDIESGLCDFGKLC